MPLKLNVLQPATGEPAKERSSASESPASLLRILPGRIQNLQDVVDWGLCTGCGACYYYCDRHAVSLKNIPAVGIRPQFASPDCASCTKCLSICPGYSVDAGRGDGNPTPASQAEHEFGPALEIWEGYAQDPEIRFKASSGGILSALALYCLEREGMQFVLHTDADNREPWSNRTVKSTTKAEIVSRTGSRYAPSSPCEGLQAVEDSEGECVFIGKPCDASAVDMLRRQRPGLDAKIGLVLAFFCAGVPSTQGTLNLLTSLGIDPQDVDSMRYRGEGWPGRFTVQRGDRAAVKSMSYADSWGKLTSYRPMRCNICPDGLGRIADIACGDAWERLGGEGDLGTSVVIVRTERGRQILHGAIAARYVDLERVDERAVFSAQPQLLQRRREVFGRLLGMHLLAVPATRFVGFSLLHSWIRQPLPIKVRSVLGTVKRFIQRAWWKRRSVTAT